MPEINADYIESIHQFITQELVEVEGWLGNDAALMTALLLEDQNNSDINSGMFEIGVYKGKYLSLLYKQSQITETVLGVDPFEWIATEEDVVNSIKTSCNNSDRLKLLKASSFSLTSEEVIAACGQRPRFISIDGEHSSSALINDLTLSGRSMSNNGIISIDDVSNSMHPSVFEGVCRYFIACNYEQLVPFALVNNKLFVCKKEYFHLYYNNILSIISKIEAMLPDYSEILESNYPNIFNYINNYRKDDRSSFSQLFGTKIHIIE